ncbi:MAG: DOMON domain-containing protein [Spirochaetia bacterium]
MKKIVLGFSVFLLLVSAVIFSGGAQEAVPEESGDGFKEVEAEGVQLKWRAGDDNIEFVISAPTTGWVSVGFNPSRAMKDGHFIFGYVKEGEPVVEDHYGSGTFSHKSDEELGGSRDIISFDGSESDGVTTLEFTIPIDSGDEYDTPLTLSQEHTVLLAYGPDGADDFSTKHSKKGKVLITF